MIMIYLDSKNGNDSNNGLNTLSARKTLLGLLNILPINEDCEIYLLNGTYEYDQNFINNVPNTKISIIGTGINTVLKQIESFSKNSSGSASGNINSEISIIRVLYDFCEKNEYSSNSNSVNNKFNFYNVVFIRYKRAGFSMWRPVNTTLFSNCIFVEKGIPFSLRAAESAICVTGTYGYLINGYATTTDMWDKGNNIITSEIKLDSKYMIIDENVKTYETGVYCGLYKWVDFTLELKSLFIKNQLIKMGYTVNNFILNAIISTLIISNSLDSEIAVTIFVKDGNILEVSLNNKIFNNNNSTYYDKAVCFKYNKNYGLVSSNIVHGKIINSNTNNELILIHFI